MKTDITTQKDILFVISTFYDKLLNDEKMKPFFSDLVENNQLAQHLDSITNFWSDILFQTQTYSQNVMQKHIDKNTFVRFKKEHFSIWISYFTKTIDGYFKGENTERMKSRALSIATMMQVKMNLYQ